MRLLSFLTAIEQALLAESPGIRGEDWESLRMVNFHHHLARLTISRRDGNERRTGAIFIQGFALADGSNCVKAYLNWDGSESHRSFAVYSTPHLDWEREASRIAKAWLEGPGTRVTSASERNEYRPLVAMAG